MHKWHDMRALTRTLLAICLPWLAAVALAATPARVDTVAASSSSVITAAPGITLEQAVAKVQQRTHGTVLSAASRKYGDTTEYRIKILTPDGHVRVIPVRSRPSRKPQHKP
ncbi:MAG TPA: PepSY domain-containing protein [Oleiagrimonas sp.]|nr:PepSY domain-containing protein [Oleiagrimonas sp.]